jgi:hypothetical protein
MFTLQLVGDDVSIGDRSQASEPVVLGLPTVNLLAIVLNG